MKLLAVFAHPDDESFGPGGTLAKYAFAGHQVGLVTMTRGESGSLGISKYLSNEELAHRRGLELECAAQELKINYIKIYEFPDKKLAEFPPQKVHEKIRFEIQNFKPDTVITFHPTGISGHQDHKLVSRWTKDVVENSNSPIRLLYYGITTDQAAKMPHRVLHAMQEGKITHRIDVSEYLSYKIEAMKCHSTQEELWKQFEAVPGDLQEFAGIEHFSQIIPSSNGNEVQKDLL